MWRSIGTSGVHTSLTDIISTPLDLYNWAWQKRLSKLLGIPFGLNLSMGDVDHVFISKNSKKLDY